MDFLRVPARDVFVDHVVCVGNCVVCVLCVFVVGGWVGWGCWLVLLSWLSGV